MMLASQSDIYLSSFNAEAKSKFHAAVAPEPFSSRDTRTLGLLDPSFQGNLCFLGPLICNFPLSDLLSMCQLCGPIAVCYFLLMVFSCLTSFLHLLLFEFVI